MNHDGTRMFSRLTGTKAISKRFPDKYLFRTVYNISDLRLFSSQKYNRTADFSQDFRCGYERR
jgi:hypothetical protein